MKTKKPVQKKRYFTVAEANSTLPLARAIVQDIAALVRDLRQRHERLSRLRPNDRLKLGAEYEEEVQQVTAEFERDQERMAEYVKELTDLGIELKDYDTGLIDFLCRFEGREVYLCWRLGEPEVSHWHELDGGFAGRREITANFCSHEHAGSSSLNS
jgi:hypothetical protein